jgi:hypothetical protein
MFSLILGLIILIMGWIVDLIFKDQNYIFLTFLMIYFLYIFCMLISNLCFYSYLIYQIEKFNKTKKLISLYEIRIKNCLEDIKNICLIKYPEYESKIFDKIIEIKSLIVKIPKIKQDKNIGILIEKIEKYNKDIISESENLFIFEISINGGLKNNWFFIPKNILKNKKE